MNCIVPGTGLIALGRTWLGVALAIWFGLGAEAAACGALIAPASLPTAVTVIGALFAAGAWVLGQGLLLSRIRLLRDPNLRDELAILRRMAEQSLLAGDYRTARSVLLAARSLDDSEVATCILWARLITLTGKRSRARRAWLQAARLDAHHRFAQEIRDALDGLQAVLPASGRRARGATGLIPVDGGHKAAARGVTTDASQKTGNVR